MTELDLVSKKLSLIETCVREIREIARLDEIQTNIVDREDLGDLLAFVAALRERLGAA